MAPVSREDAVPTGNGTALVVCHAVGILAFTRTADGEFLVDGRKLHYWVEDEARAACARWDAELGVEGPV